MGILTRLARGTRWERLVLPPIETARLRVAPLEPGDAAAVAQLTDDPAITGAIEFLPKRFGIEDARGLIRAARGGRDLFLGLRVRSDPDAASGEVVGVVGAHLRALNAVEIGYWVGGAARGRGYGREAVAAVVRSLVLNHPRRAVVAECRPDNVASWRMLHELGFRPTGDDGNRPGRRLLVWDVRDAPPARPGEGDAWAAPLAAPPVLPNRRR